MYSNLQNCKIVEGSWLNIAKPFLIPESDCNTALETIDTSKLKFNVAVINGINFNKNDLLAVCKCHQLRELKKRVSSEKLWIKKMIDTYTDYEEYLLLYQEVLLKNVDDSLALNKSCNKRLLTSDIALMANSSWINLELINFFCEMLSKNKENHVFMTLPELLLISSDIQSTVSSWKAKGIESFCFIVNCRREGSTTYTANQKQMGNHWSSFIINIKENLCIYGDSLGWSFPVDLVKILSFFMEAVDSIYNISTKSIVNNLICGHKPHSSNKCVKGHCIHDFTYQGQNMDICGVAALFTSLVISKNSNLKTIVNEKTFPCFLAVKT